MGVERSELWLELFIEYIVVASSYLLTLELHGLPLLVTGSNLAELLGRLGLGRNQAALR